MTAAAGAACLAGWAQVARHPGEPLEAWADVLAATGIGPGRIDSLDVLYCQSWQYDEPASRLADAVGATPRRRHDSGIGGTTPIVLLAEAAERVASGAADVCAVVGGEALHTVRGLRKAGLKPRWSFPPAHKRPFPFDEPFHPAEVAHQVFQAYSTYALRDVARRAHLGIDVDKHRWDMGALFAPMTAVAASNPYAWSPVELDVHELVDPTPANRMVAYPYTKRLMSQMDVDLSAAVIVASPDAVRGGGEVFLRSARYASDPSYVAEHDELWRSPAMAAALDAGVDDIELLDLYSCFPSAVAFALDALGLEPDDERAPFTVTGGLPFAGGPGSCAALHAVAAMADRLVGTGARSGMVSGIGMHLSKHASLVLDTEPGPFRFERLDVHQPRRPIVEAHDGPATVAAYTVHHGRDGAPTDALFVCDVVPGGTRCYAIATDAGLLGALEEDEWVGRTVHIAHDEGVNRARI